MVEYRCLWESAYPLASSTRRLPDGSPYVKVNEGMVCGFGVSLSVKEQRVVGAARNRPVIFPRISIRYTPESDPADLILMLQKQPKDLLVPLGQLILNFGGKPVCIGLQFVPPLRTHLHIGSQILKRRGQQSDRKLDHQHIYTQAGKPC